MKILLTGASGTLGAEVIRVMEGRGDEMLKTDLSPREADCIALDVTKIEDVERHIASFSPDYVFHLAAHTDVDRCENEPEAAFRINYLGTENIAFSCRKVDIPMLYISTGCVFDGGKTEPYTEFDEPVPVNVYARSKYAGEIAVVGNVPRYFIMRAGWMIGDMKLDKKFVSKILSLIDSGKKKIEAVNDKFGTPCFARDFAEQIPILIETQRYGLYHCANNEMATRYDIARLIVELLGLQGEVEVVPVGSERFPLPAPRPRSEAIVNYKMELNGINIMPPWRDSLERYIESYE
jgi:dTDP-4-dehydrorhamnose reductase